jgi:hypothetical protein
MFVSGNVQELALRPGVQTIDGHYLCLRTLWGGSHNTMQRPTGKWCGRLRPLLDDCIPAPAFQFRSGARRLLGNRVAKTPCRFRSPFLQVPMGKRSVPPIRNRGNA